MAELKAGAAPHRAAAVLAHIKDSRALQLLIEGLRHRDPRARTECASALGELRDPGAVEALMQATRDPDHRVRSQAGWALDQLGTVAVVIGVTSLLRPVIDESIAATNGAPSWNGLGSIDPAELERLLAGTEGSE